MAKVKIVLHSKPGKDGRHAVMMRIYHRRKTLHKTLNIYCLPEQWDAESGRLKKNFLEYKKKNKVLNALEYRAENIIDDFIKRNKIFSFQAFEREFYNLPKFQTVDHFLTQRTEDLKKSGKINTRGVYKQLQNMLRKFSNEKDIHFEDIDYTFLKKLETHLFANGCNGGGVNNYMRTLRATLNEAIRQGFMRREDYPFSNIYNRNGYSLGHLKSNPQPRALSDDDLEKMKIFPAEAYPKLENSYWYFMFSYYARGMNFNDMAELKYSDIYDGRITYIRNKTKKSLSIGLSEPIAAILEYFKDKNFHYVFPVLFKDFHKTESQKKYRIQKCLGKTNRDLKEIARLLDIRMPLTTYVARHTYATRLKRKGIPIAVISECMGHEDVKTTDVYLKSFDSSILDAADKVL